MSSRERSYSLYSQTHPVLVLPSGKIVLATGVFDLLHLGHLRFLEESK
ncbi:hypothetical protein E6H32_10645, partial [Candidatus Bathyarchaeota archaeon]